ncbi:MAG: DUF3656 domain-containing U32 family peptidase [Bacillota bacterium]
MNKVELLAPVGSWDALVAAVQNGANAVYLGGKEFNARQFAGNFDREELIKAVAYCHIRDVKVFVTVNTLIADEEIIEFGKYIGFLNDIDVDAVIVQDLGAAKLIRDIFPDMELHGSTQMSVHNLQGVRLLEDLGFTRMVLAREMSVDEIKYIYDNCKAELEVFVHGALCVCYSGQCLMSSMIGGRSGNRGKCAQPCRMTYSLVDMDSGKKVEADEGNYLLSPRDLNTLEDIDKIIKTGAVSLKIEGRMKRPEYVAIVVGSYRKAIDEYSKYKKSLVIEEAIKKDVMQIFNRKFTKGYILGESGREMMSYMKPSNRGIEVGNVISYDKANKRVKIRLSESLSVGDGIEIWSGKGDHPGTVIQSLMVDKYKKDQAKSGDTVEFHFKQPVAKNDLVYRTSQAALLSKAAASYEKEEIQIPIYGRFYGKIGEPVTLSLWDDDGHNCTETGDYLVEKAVKTATDPQRIREQLSKIGGTPYRMKELDLEIDEEINVPIGVMNQMRRDAVEQLNLQRSRRHHRSAVTDDDIVRKIEGYKEKGRLRKCQDPMITIGVQNLEQLAAVLELNIPRIYYHDPLTFFEAKEISKSTEAEVVPAFSRITDDRELQWIADNFTELPGTKKVLAGNLGIIHFFKNHEDVDVITDYSLNSFNHLSIMKLKDMGVEEVTLSPELTLKQIKRITEVGLVPCEAIVHGHLPVMVSKYCPISSINLKGRKQEHCSLCRNSRFGLKDRMGMVFPMMLDRNCRMHLLNSQKLCMIEHMKELMDARIDRFRIQFTIEKSEEIKETINAYLRAVGKVLGKEIGDERNLENFVEKMKEQGLTKGHFYRGVV